MPKHATEDRARTFWNLSGFPLTLYVRPAGSDMNDGMTANTAFKTVKRAMYEMEKDFWNGRYIIDITGCDIDEKIEFSPVRGIYALTGVVEDEIDEYGALLSGSVNFRAQPIVQQVFTYAWEAVNQIDQWTYQVTVAGQAWEPSELKGCFVCGLDDNNKITTRPIPIIDNAGDTFDVPVGIQMPGAGRAGIVRPGARVHLNGRRYWELDGVSGYTFYGIQFEVHEFEGLVATNSDSTSIEACTIIGNRFRVGGSGLTRLTRCYLNSLVRHSGGSYIFIGCVFNGDEVFSSGYLFNEDSLTTPVPSQISFKDCNLKQDFGSLEGESYRTFLVMRDCKIGRWLGWEWGGLDHVAGEINNCYVGGVKLGFGSMFRFYSGVAGAAGGVELQRGSHVFFNTTELHGDLTTPNGVEMTDLLNTLPPGIGSFDLAYPDLGIHFYGTR